MPTKEILSQSKEKMKKSVHTLEEKFKTLRTGRASVQHFEHIQVEYYGTRTPLNQISNISIPEPRLVVIQPWDTNAIAKIEQAILATELSVNPQNDGKLIRISIPPLTDETRQKNIKLAKHLCEEAKVALRNIRRDANDKLKVLQHDSAISEDALHFHEHEMQKLTDDMNHTIQSMLIEKEKEINEI